MSQRDVREGPKGRAEKERTLIVAPQSFFTASGTPINILQMSRALVQLGYEVHLLTLPLGEDVELPGLIHHRVARLPFVKNVPSGFSLPKVPYNLLILIWLVYLLSRHRFKVVHAIEEAAFYSVPLARLFGTAAICDLDSDIPGQLADHRSAVVRLLISPSTLLRRWALRTADAAITVASPLSRIVADASPATPVFEIKDIPLEEALRQPDPDETARIREALDLNGKKVVVYTGNYHRRQGVEGLVEAMAVVGRHHPDSVLVIVGGTANDVERIGNLVERLGISAFVRPIGAQPTDKMAEYMGIASVLVSPRLEPLITPLKIYSYMASGRPIVATNLPTHTDVLDTQAAILTPATPEGLAAGIVEAFDDPVKAEALGNSAQELIRSKYNFDAFKARLQSAYNAATNPRAKTANAH